MAAHVVYIGLVQVNGVGGIVDKYNATIAERINASSQPRVIPDAAIPNSAGYPTIEDYITSESDDGYAVVSLTNTTIVTQN